MGDAFYASGLRFSCARCSCCCRGEPGFVFLSKDDLRRLLRRTKLDLGVFIRDYCRLIDTGDGMTLSLREKAAFDCVFWTNGGCSVYEDRPIQCSTYPFWASIMESNASWKAESRYCPGIGAGELRSREYIEGRLLARREAGNVILAYGVDPECIDENSILGSEGLGPDAPHAVEG
jgi:uncharacterized protein